MPRFDTLTRLFGAAVVAALSGGYAFAQAGAAQDAAPDPYQHDVGWLKPPEGRKMGQSINVDIDRDGKSVWVYDRCGRADCIGSKLDPIQKFDASGRLLASFGAGMFNHPHGLYVDADGNVWVTDDHGGDGKGHQVFKFSPQGKVLLTLGRAGTAGEGPDTFNAPTDVMVAPNGDIFVSDGHGGETNARIVKFTKDGRFIRTWGQKGAGPGEFNIPHSLALDAAGRLFVADRANNRIQIFDQDGGFIAQWRQFGRPSGLFIDRNGLLYSTDSESDAARNPGFRRGVTIGSAKDGKVTAFIPEPVPATEGRDGGESVAVDDAGHVFVGMNSTRTVERYVRK
jgi:DNA-binding beta-propeller fold protein YncE